MFELLRTDHTNSELPAEFYIEIRKFTFNFSEIKYKFPNEVIALVLEIYAVVLLLFYQVSSAIP